MIQIPVFGLERIADVVDADRLLTASEVDAKWLACSVLSWRLLSGSRGRVDRLSLSVRAMFYRQPLYPHLMVVAFSESGFTVEEWVQLMAEGSSGARVIYAMCGKYHKRVLFKNRCRLDVRRENLIVRPSEIAVVSIADDMSPELELPQAVPATITSEPRLAPRSEVVNQVRQPSNDKALLEIMLGRKLDDNEVALYSNADTGNSGAITPG